MKLKQFLTTKLEAFFDKLTGPTLVYEEIIFEPNKALDFFNKLEEYKVALYIVKDPYKLAFAPNHLLWFMQDATYYEIVVSPESKTWGMLQHYFEIFFPTGTDHPWRKEILWEEFEKKKIKLA